jgi:hypothetical protein
MSDSILIPVPRFLQPDDTSCGPTCLWQVLRYWGVEADLESIIEGTRRHQGGGTIAVWLGLHALERGFRTLLYTFHLKVFDPTWARLRGAELVDKLAARRRFVRRARLKTVIRAYEDYVRAGGEIRWRELTPGLLIRHLDRGEPVLTGLSATYLYGTAREREDSYDDVRGDPVGHFVVVCGHRDGGSRFILRDPARLIPMSKTGKYSVPAQRLLNAILLGSTTYDANLLVIRPGSR